jgi:hypothetical protein
VTEAISHALDLYHRTLLAKIRTGDRDLLSLGALFEDVPNLSERYKEVIAERLDDKLSGHR